MQSNQAGNDDGGYCEQQVGQAAGGPVRVECELVGQAADGPVRVACEPVMACERGVRGHVARRLVVRSGQLIGAAWRNATEPVSRKHDDRSDEAPALLWQPDSPVQRGGPGVIRWQGEC